MICGEDASLGPSAPVGHPAITRALCQFAPFAGLNTGAVFGCLNIPATLLECTFIYLSKQERGGGGVGGGHLD